MSSSEGSKKVVIAAFFANLGIAVFKFVAAFFSGSSSMLAEGYHSVSDTINQVLLFIGLKAGKKPADKLHPFGYGREQYFWSFIVAMLIFFVAGVLSVREGIHKLGNPQPLEQVWLSVLSLLVAMVFESSALVMAIKELKEKMAVEGITSYWQAIKYSKDTTVLSVLFEDSLAISGLIIALLAITFTAITGNVYIDAGASILIGLLLMVFSLVLAKENKHLLIGEAVTPYYRKKLIETLSQVKNVRDIIDLKTLHFSPTKVLVACELNFADELTTDEVEQAIDVVESKIREILPEAVCYIEAESPPIPDNSEELPQHSP